MLSGQFGPESAVRRIGRESVLMLGAGRALLAQAAHPLVAAGIVQHSSYGTDPWTRLGRTMLGIYTIVFGTREEAGRVGCRVQAVHGRVRGGLAEPVGTFAAGTEYSALDPELALWVHATLVENALAMHRLLVGPVAPSDEEAFWQDMKIVAGFFGLRSRTLPATAADFRVYWQGMLDGDVLAVGRDGRLVADGVLTLPVPLPLRPALLAFRGLTIATLAPQLRALYGLQASRADRALVAGTAPALRHAVLPLVPSKLRRLADERGDGLPFRLLRALAA